jgi:hypothetical protein
MDYSDGKIECDDTGVRIRDYYFPGVSKRVPYGAFRDLTRVQLGAIRGRGRIWGTGNPRYWANLDIGRPKKKVGFVADLGKAVRPLITPDDPDSFERVVRSRANLGPAPGGSVAAPFI